MEERQQRKTRAGPARNPGTPRPGARRHGKRKTQPTNNMIQSFNSKTIYTRLPHAVTCCIRTRMTNFNKENAGVKLYSGTLTDKRTWATQDDPRPALTPVFLQYSSWKMLKGDGSSAVHLCRIKASVHPTSGYQGWTQAYQACIQCNHAEQYMRIIQSNANSLAYPFPERSRVMSSLLSNEQSMTPCEKSQQYPPSVTVHIKSYQVRGIASHTMDASSIGLPRMTPGLPSQ